MSDEALRVEFKLPTRTSATPKPPAVAKAEHQRQDRTARLARNLALAYYIDDLIRSGEVPDLASVARMCGVSRARVSQVAGMLSLTATDLAVLLAPCTVATATANQLVFQ